MKHGSLTTTVFWLNSKTGAFCSFHRVARYFEVLLHQITSRAEIYVIVTKCSSIVSLQQQCGKIWSDRLLISEINLLAILTCATIFLKFFHQPRLVFSHAQMNFYLSYIKIILKLLGVVLPHGQNATDLLQVVPACCNLSTSRNKLSSSSNKFIKIRLVASFAYLLRLATGV